MAGYTYKQSVISNSGNLINAASFAQSFTPNASGNLIGCILVVQSNTTTGASTIQDNNSNNFVQRLSPVVLSTGPTHLSYWDMVNCPAGINTITVTLGASVSAWGFLLFEYNFLQVGYSFQQLWDMGYNSPSASVISTTTATAATAQPALMVGFGASNIIADHGTSAGTGWNGRFFNNSSQEPCSFLEDLEKLALTTTTLNVGSTTNAYEMVIAAYTEGTGAVIQSAQSAVASGASSITATLSATQPLSSIVVACPVKTSTNSAVLSVTDSASNTYTRATQSSFITEGASFGVSAIFYCLNPTSGVTTVTLNTNTGTLSGSITGVEMVGQALIDTSGSLSQSAASSVVVNGSAVDAGANDVSVACFQQQGTTSNDGPSVSATWNVLQSTASGVTNCNMVAWRQNTTVIKDQATFSWTGGSAPSTAALASFYNPLTGFLVRPSAIIPLEDVIYY